MSILHAKIMITTTVDFISQNWKKMLQNPANDSASSPLTYVNVLFPHYWSCSLNVEVHICFNMLSISSKSLKTLCLSLSDQASPNSTDSRCGWVPVGLFHNTRESNINDGKLHGEHGGRQSEADGGRRHPLGDLIRYGPERERESERW